MQKTTFGERGDLLSFGIPAGDAHGRTFAFKPWRTADEKAVGAIRDRNRGITPAAFASEAMAHFLTEWGGVDFTKLSIGERRLYLARGYAGDVFQTWIQLRRSAMGDSFDMQLECRSCRTEFVYTADLASLELNVADDGEDLRQQVALLDGFDWRGEDVREVTIAPLRWSLYETQTASINTGMLKVRAAAQAICGINGKPLASPLPESALDLTKRDLEAIASALDADTLGPQLAIEEFCPHCGSRVRQSLSWTYDAFFSGKASGRGGA